MFTEVELNTLYGSGFLRSAKTVPTKEPLSIEEQKANFKLKERCTELKSVCDWLFTKVNEHSSPETFRDWKRSYDAFITSTNNALI